MNRKILTAGGASVLLVAAATFAFMQGNTVGARDAGPGDGAQRQGPPPATVAVAKAEMRSLAPVSEAPGSVVSTRDSLVAAQTAGRIDWVAEIGAEVEAGDLIARIDEADALLARNDSAAEVKRLEARGAYLESLYQRFVGLGEEAGESEATLDEMRANRDEALQALARAEVALERAEINLARTEVKAPFAGRVVSQEMQVGEFAGPGAGVIRLVDTRNLEVTARAPANLARNIRAGDTIRVAAGAQMLQGELRAIVPVGDDRSRMLELRLELPDSSLHIGAAVRVSLPASEERRVVAVPRDALILRANEISVFTIDEENVAHKVSVELGVAEGEFIEVIGEIRAGESVVIRGGERLRDNQPVTISTIEVAPSV